MIGAVGLLRAVLTLQLALVAAAGIWRLLNLGPARRVRWGRALLLTALLAPLLAPMVPIDPPYSPPAKVWAGRRSGDREPVASLDGLAGKPTTMVAARVPLDAGVAVVLMLSAAGLVGLSWTLLGVRRLLGPAVRWRRLRGVEILVSPAASTPCTLRIPRPIIVLDPQTFADPTLRLIAVRHELQHQRSGDASFAWVLSLTGALSFANPVATWWRSRLRDDEELACDAALLARGVPALDYAEALYRSAARARVSAFPGLVSPKPSLLKRRIEAMMKPSQTVGSLGARALSLLAIPLVLSVAWAADRVVSDRRVDLAEVQRVAARVQPRTELPVVGNAAVQDALERMIATPGGLAWVRGGLERREAMGPVFEDALAEAGLPPALAAIPLVESGYQNLTGAELSPSVPEQSRGAGYWMFIKSTAREYGLVVTETVDERRDVEKETAAAIDLLSDLHAQYGDWGLALAAYNQGPKRVDQAIAKGGTRDVWALQEQGLLNDYVAQVIAATLILAEPGLAD